jgi:pre ATP-grasp domain-containing protein
MCQLQNKRIISCAGLTFLEEYPVELSPSEKTHITTIAKSLKQKYTLDTPEQYHPDIHQGLVDKPKLLMEDHSWIRLFETEGDEAYSYRSLLFADENDLVVIGVKRCKSFENYCHQTLGFGKPDILMPEQDPRPKSLTTRCINDSKIINTIVSHARQNEGLNIVPYMGTSETWRLAAIIADRSAVSVNVAAPLPALTQMVNNKVWFTQCVSELLGNSSVPPAHKAYNLSLLTKEITDLVQRYDKVAIKLADSASSAGIIVIDSGDLRGVPLHEVKTCLEQLLTRRRWCGTYPLMASAWESPIMTTPSVHFWIPDRAEGDPILEGIFDQVVSGINMEFTGAIPTELDTNWQNKITHEASMIAMLFQELGYFGRCSLDAILVGNDLTSARLHWVECNGRWGGVSIPLSLAHRLCGHDKLTCFMVIEEAHLKNPPTLLENILKRLDKDLFNHVQNPGGAIILSPSRFEAGNGFEFMIIENSIDIARETARRIAGSFNLPATT